MRARLVVHRLLSLLISLSLILTPSAQIAQAQPTHTQAVSLRPEPPAQSPNPLWLPFIGIGGQNAAPTSDLLYRVRLAVSSPARWQRLEEMGVVILERDEISATVLVDFLQLEQLAKLQFQPRGADELSRLVNANGEKRPWLARAMRPVLEEAAAVRRTVSPTYEIGAASAEQLAALDALRASLRALTVEERTALADSFSLDDDGDGLTNTEESWWCTDPLNPNSDGDAKGHSDGKEVAALLDVTKLRTERWGYGPPYRAWPPFVKTIGVGEQPTCLLDSDEDSIPDLAEIYVVGTRVPAESTDFDKFDDGQELFGVTRSNYGDYPRAVDSDYITAEMPRWVLPPGDSPFVAAFPIPEIHVLPDPDTGKTWNVERVTTITTSEGEMVQKSNSYEASVTRGQSTSIANTVTWNEWEEVSQAVETPIRARNRDSQISVSRSNDAVDVNWKKFIGGTALVAGGGAVATTVGGLAVGSTAVGTTLATVGIAGCVVSVVCLGVVGAGTAVAAVVGGMLIQDSFKDDMSKDTGQFTQHNSYDNRDYSSQVYDYSTHYSQSNLILNNNNFDSQGIVNSLDGVQYAINQQGALISRGLQDISYQISRPRLTETKTNGKSWGGAQTTTHEVYEEHTITQGEAFTSGQNWSTAWAVDSSHAANLTFRYAVQNAGTEYAKELTNLVFNIYIGDDKLPAISYKAWEQFADGKLGNLFPVGPNTPPGVVSSKVFASDPIALSLEQMKRIDLGERLTVKVENFSFGADENFYVAAISGGVTVFIEDGVEDGDETVDQYVIPTWGVETVQDVLTRYFPAGTDADGNLNALWTPEFNGDATPTWNEHFLSDIAWWNVYLTQADAGDTPLHLLPARSGSGLLFRFNRDSDRDGYNDRAELRYYCALPSSHAESKHCADGHLRPEIHPQPELLAGYVVERNGTIATVKLALENTGSFDAYGIDAVLYSPDETTTIGNNTVGGNGVVRAGRQVVVGSLIKAPSLGGWLSSRSKPYSAGQFSGGADRTFTFSAQTPGVVGTGSTAVAWNDGAGNSGVLNLGSDYHAPLPLDVAQGLQVGFNTGTIDAGASFTVTALTPRDTFTFTINSEPFTPPVVVVSYSDPQGSRRFVTPVELPWLGDALSPHTGRMLKGLAAQIVTAAPFTPSGRNSTSLVVNSPHPATIVDGHLHLNFVSDGKLVLEKSYTLDFPPGPTTFTAEWAVSEFSADYKAAGDNLLIAFWTDSENNIIDSAARPLNSFAADPKPAADSDATLWDFGTVTQGEVLKRSVSIASVGDIDLLAYVSGAPGLSISQTGSKPLGLGDLASYALMLDTRVVPSGPYTGTVTLRTSDPVHPLYTVQVIGTVAPMIGDAYARSLTDRPLDAEIWVVGDRPSGASISFDHPLQSQPENLHPVKVYGLGESTPYGVGKVIAAPAVTGVTINATVLSVEAGCHGDFGILSPINQPIFQDYHAYIGHTRSVSYSGDPQSEVYYIWGGGCFGGPHPSNGEHARVSQENANSWVIRWDDTLGDRDYNDLVVRVTRNVRIENTYITEQIGVTTTQLTLPKSTAETNTYRIGYGHKLDFTAAGEMTATLRLPAGVWTATSLDALVSGVGSGDVTFKLSVGGDDSWEWDETKTIDNAGTFYTDTLAAAFAPYVTGNGEVDVPIKVYLSKPGQVLLTNMAVTRERSVELRPQLALSGTPTEGAVVPLNATVVNTGTADSGPLTVSYYATPHAARSTQYVGSVFIPTIPGGQNRPAPYNWDTLGFVGPMTVTAMVDPFNRTPEVIESNNSAATPFTILTRPDLAFNPAAITLSDDEPVVGEVVTVTASLKNSGQTQSGSQKTVLYRGNPESGGVQLQPKTVSAIGPGANRTVVFTWTPTTTGWHRLFVRTDKDGQVNESDEGNNDRWVDVYVGVAGPVLLDSGAGEPVYSESRGNGVIDADGDDVTGSCGNAAYQSFRRDPNGPLAYRFDHLLPGHFYHLDITLYNCPGEAQRLETVTVDNVALTTAPVDLGDRQVHRLSFLIDPALYAQDRSIGIVIAADGVQGTVVSEVNLHDVDYRYADAGGQNDPRYPGNRAFGWEDGSANTTWGTLPSHSVRVDQTDRELVYRFDGLRSDKRYTVHLAFRQGSGSTPTTLKVQMDGVDAGSTFTINTGERMDKHIAVSPIHYQSDGSIRVGIVRPDANGPFVNEIALEEQTVEATVSCVALPTPSGMNVYGSVTISGAPAPVGTVIQAINPRGDTVGCVTVTTAGAFPFLRVFGEDAGANPPIPGMQSGERITFRVAGALASSTPSVYWQQGAIAETALKADPVEGQSVLLNYPWNLISLRVDPPAPLAQQVFSSIENRYDLVLSETGVFIPGANPLYNTLKEIHCGPAYYVRLTSDPTANLLAEGLPCPVDTPISLHAGWNWIGYLPAAALPVAQALAGIDGKYQQVQGISHGYYPTLPGASNLTHLEPDQGYLIYMNEAAVLVYPATAAAGAPEPVTTAGLCGGVLPTPYATLLYGGLTINGQPAPVGSRVELVTAQGETAGCIETTEPGVYRAVFAYGADETASPRIPGFVEGEPIGVRVNGIPVPLETPLLWSDDKELKEVNLSLNGLRNLYIPSVQQER